MRYAATLVMAQNRLYRFAAAAAVPFLFTGCMMEAEEFEEPPLEELGTVSSPLVTVQSSFAECSFPGVHPDLAAGNLLITRDPADNIVATQPYACSVLGVVGSGGGLTYEIVADSSFIGAVGGIPTCGDCGAIPPGPPPGPPLIVPDGHTPYPYFYYSKSIVNLGTMGSPVSHYLGWNVVPASTPRSATPDPGPNTSYCAGWGSDAWGLLTDPNGIERLPHSMWLFLSSPGNAQHIAYDPEVGYRATGVRSSTSVLVPTPATNWCN